MCPLSSPAQRYLFAVLVIGTTLTVRSLMAPLWETTAPFALFMFATVVTAWLAGTGPALLTSAAGISARLYFDSPHDGGPWPVTGEEAVRLTLFAGFAAASVVVLERMKSDRRQLEASIAAAQAEIAERARMEQTLVAARAEAEEANRLKDEFLAMVSHELRTPLNAILGWVALLRGGSLSTPYTVHALEVVDRNARLQAELVADLLDVARSLTGRLHVEPSDQVDLLALARETAEQVRGTALGKGVELAVELPEGDLPVWGERDRLRQVIAKLLTNAIKFTPAPGRVTLSLARVGSFAEIVVTDTGIGIPPAFLPHVFERFTQADTGSTRQHGGLGLGLAIVRQLVDLHRGHIQVTSDGEGRGARFIVRLPVGHAARHPDDRPPAVLPETSMTGGAITGVAMPARPASAEET